MNEILEGMKVIKLYAWEPSFAKKIQKIRVEEISMLKKMSYLGAIQRFLSTTAQCSKGVAKVKVKVFKV